jgi:putative phosphoesterase
MATEIGIISDTHNHLPKEINQLFDGVDIIFHAGDIGNSPILQQLHDIAPTQAIYGNMDLYTLSSVLPAQVSVKIEEFQILMQHNIGNLFNFYWKLRNKKPEPFPDIVIFGHTHRPVYESIEETLFINPGSASQARGGFAASVMRLELAQGKILHHTLIEIS